MNIRNIKGLLSVYAYLNMHAWRINPLCSLRVLVANFFYFHLCALKLLVCMFLVKSFFVDGNGWVFEGFLLFFSFCI